MHWFKRHPEFLKVESESLAKDGNYKQLYLIRNSLLLSHGLVLVRLDKIYRFPILIVYSEATPFELPSIFILKDKLEESFLQELSQLNLGELYNKIKPHIKFYYNLRHQNASGVLCILEWDNLDDGTQYLGISTILKRIRDWCAGTITGVFPPDNQETEFAAHFNDVDSSIRFLYPEGYLDTGLICGEAYAQLYTLLPKLSQTQEEYRIYIGCLLLGEDSRGIMHSINFEAAGLFREEGIKNPTDLYTKPELLQAKLDSKDWLKCFWFHLNSAPAPFVSVNELILILGEGDRSTGLILFHRIVYQGLRHKPACFFIGLRFPNRKGELEFQLFKIYKNNENHPTLFGGLWEEVIEAFVASYTRVSAVESEKFTEQSFHLRNSGRANHEQLKDKVINIIGTGALGSEIADSLNKAGPGAIVLFDNQRVKAHNAVRHLCGINQIGLPKVIAVAQYLREHNPFVYVKYFADNINRFPVEDVLLDKSISISSIADDNVEAYFNERTVLAGKTIFYVRALRGGKVARIFRVIPGKDACFQCLNLYRNDKKVFIDIPSDETLPTLKNECNNPIRPASAADLKLIAALASRIVIDHLQSGPSDKNQWIWSSESLDTTPVINEWQLHGQFIPPHPRCLYCHHDKQLKVTFNQTTLSEMQEMVSKKPERETGGVLAGFILKDGSLNVKFASGPGPNAVCTETRFEKDVPFCQAFLDDIYEKAGAIYLGEWHSHPSENTLPSGTDLKSLSEIAVQQNYLTEHPLMVILSRKALPSFSIHPANKVFYYVKAEII